jgi:ethanolamine utilization protein EutM
LARNALGLIEVVGMTAAIVAADTAVKSANVRLLGYENAKGGGMITVKFEGDVGAVKAALESASAAASKVNRIISKHLIPRPSAEIEKMTIPKSKAPLDKQSESLPEVEKELEIANTVEISNQVVLEAHVIEEEVSVEKQDPEKQEDVVMEEQTEKKFVEQDEPAELLLEVDDHEVCNICKDPNCTRRKGEARTMCIHYHASVGGK